MSSEITVVWDEGLTEHEAVAPHLNDVMELVDALDGGQRTLVTVFHGGAHAAVGGSAASGLIVYVTFDGVAFHQLISRAPDSDALVTVIAGGQAGEYPHRLVVDPAEARAALRVFIDERALDTDQSWELS